MGVLQLGASQRSRAVLLVCLLAASAVRAAPAPPPAAEDAGQQAKVAYQAGQKAFNLGHYDEALALFEKAYNAKPVVGLLYNVAQCHRLLGNLEQARRVYRAFISQTPDARQSQAAKEKLEELEQVLASQTKARESQPTSLVAIDKPAVAPGELESATREAGANARPDGQRRESAASKPAAPEASTALPPRRAEADEGSRHITFWGALGAGAVAGGAGLYFGLQSKSAHDALAAGGQTRGAADQQLSTLDRDAKLGNLLVIGGAVLLAGAAAAWFFGAP